jgi:hypothetical protein
VTARRRVVLVGCSQRKLDHPAEAQELYASELFQKSAAYARSVDRWFIVSAEHGLVRPDMELQPYDRSITELSQPARQAWAQSVAAGLQELEPGTVAGHGRRLGAIGAQTAIMLLAGRDYAEPLMPLIEMILPLRGMRTDARLSWLNQQLSSLQGMEGRVQ